MPHAFFLFLSKKLSGSFLLLLETAFHVCRLAVFYTHIFLTPASLANPTSLSVSVSAPLVLPLFRPASFLLVAVALVELPPYPSAVSSLP